MKRIIMVAACLLCWTGMSYADDAAYFKAGPLELNIPFKVGRIVYLYDFNAPVGEANRVGGETPFVKLWNRVEGTLGVTTSLSGAGVPFVGGNVLLGNVLDKYITLPPDLAIGGFAGWDFRQEDATYGLKASIRLWQ